MNTYACTPSIEEACLLLGQRAEYRTDKDLYHVIQLQKIIENIESLVREQDSEADIEAAYVRVRTQLEEFRALMSVDVGDSRQSDSIQCLPSTDCIRSPVHAIPHRKIIPVPNRFLRAQSPTITGDAPQDSL